MRRHTKLILKILECAEWHTVGGFSAVDDCPAYAWHVVHYHVGLCGQARYLETREISAGEEPGKQYEIGDLTWTGHEALEHLRRQDC